MGKDDGEDTELGVLAEHGTPPGFFVRGFYLGKQPSRTFSRRDSTTGTEPAKIGVDVNGVEVPIGIGDDQEALAYGREHAKGEFVEVEIAQPTAPFGAQGPMRFLAPGVGTGRWQ